MIDLPAPGYRSAIFHARARRADSIARVRANVVRAQPGLLFGLCFLPLHILSPLPSYQRTNGRGSFTPPTWAHLWTPPATPRTTGEREREGDALVLLRVVVGRIIGRNCLLLSCNPIISPSATPLGMTGRGKPTHIGLPSTPAQKPRADSESENVWRQVHASPTAKRR